MNTYTVTVLPIGEVVQMNEVDSVFEQLKKSGINVKSTCGGCASCGQCTIVIASGEENLNEPSFEEKQLIGNVFHLTKERLSCQTRVHGSVTVDISHHLDINKGLKVPTVRRTRAEANIVLEDRKDKAREKKENKKPRIGGGRKPKPFNFNEED